ncbi:LacI family DNA-binding transcriptional regulator [Parablautia muri]|uniref:LacI family transcriptional regulator n=1 Tax=Parablautia muri TaxID=2320879 RepID=A0A9X5BG90_9FIRM|nr:LacI family DNA-binding transcriptional regulator [Parablautia muri]NBJ93243.1 LacI family transcriptional regulator [Parablautia muri]
MEVSIRDVASRAGVSISTVSRILNNTATVSEKKMLAVKEAMEYYHYEPNQFARGLKKQTSNMIGVYFPNGADSIFEVSYYLELLKGIEKVMAYQNYSMVLISESKETESRKKHTPKYLEYIRQKRIDGLILSGLTNKSVEDNADVVWQIMEEGYPVVYIGKRVHKEGLNVYAQFEQYNVQMIEVLRNSGHKKVLLFMARSHNHYVKGVMDRIHSEIPDMEIFLRVTDSHFEPRDHVLQDIKEYVLRRGCTAVCARGIEDAQILLSVCAELQIKVPEQVSLLSVEHRYDAGTLLYPQVSSFYVPAKDMGVGAAELLIDYIENREVNETSIEYETKYIERNSIRRL